MASATRNFVVPCSATIRPNVARVVDCAGVSKYFRRGVSLNGTAPVQAMTHRVSVVIPALNEEEAIADVVAGVAEQEVEDIIVVDNGSTDRTAERARRAGARVVQES